MAFDSAVFWDALFSRSYLNGAFVALSLATLVQFFAIVIGFFLALGRESQKTVLRYFTSAYVWVFRAIPALLILILVWNVLPQLVPTLRSSWFTPYMGALVGLTLLEAALMTEIIRSSLRSVDKGQKLAGKAIGLTPRQIYWHVLIPQMIRVAIPPTGNQYINMIKMTSLASVISLQELLYVAQQNVSRTFSYMEYYSAAAVYYLVIVSVLMVIQARLEKKYMWTSRVAPGNFDVRNIKTWGINNG
ncbi:amino acid ABC transporter permease [Halomonas sp. QX-2]|jgi:His/Glu/Gln/Arg/opine family amino acid ABC transporter permease subunit|uniref:Amino acid ABC transporter permease n=1 Tax=Vreelandella sedimenti TaxID=2729618 RepID=A0A7Z0N7W1_9GAMM|nr:amino acid ABC transporter permease [Halomonas sedimenti]NYT73289.1 amino acid ABC transporter permease [Halomonas sedimenti]|tara:strand:- start:4049 stop:4786 length:738 start_codon:yes stop_codon:yes gene_type:complete